MKTLLTFVFCGFRRESAVFRHFYLPVSLLLSSFMLAGCGQGSGAPDANYPSGVSFDTLLTDKVVTKLVDQEIQFDGTVEAVNQATVAAQTAGRVVELNYDVGDYVEQGATILRITDKEQAAQLDAATNLLNETKARLTSALKSYERAQQIFRQQLIAQAELDRAEAEYRSALAREKAAAAALRQAREALNYTNVEAPYEGIVLTRHVQLGETVAPGSPLMTGVSLDTLRVIVDVPQMHIGPLRKHKSARILFDSGEEALATDIRIPPSADASTHTFRVLVTLPPMNHVVAFPGTLVKVNFVSGEISRLLVPEQALVRRGEITGVYVIEQEQKMNFRYVRIGQHHKDNMVTVLAGLHDGDAVVTNPTQAALVYKQSTSATGALSDPAVKGESKHE